MIRNFLIEWYKEARYLSSPLLPTPKIERKLVEYIYDTFNKYFGVKYFDFNIKHDIPIEKHNWINAHLNNINNPGSFKALFDIAQLTNYCQGLNESVKGDFERNKRAPLELRTFFFELYIYWILDRNGVYNQKKLQLENKQIVEGICSIMGNDFLFECRKVFMPSIHELDIKKRLLTDIYSQSQKMKFGFGMILTVKLSNPITGQHRENFKNKVYEFFSELNKQSNLVKIDYHRFDDFGSFRVINYNEADYLEISDSKDYDVLFYIKPPSQPIPNIPNHYKSGIIANFSVYQSKIYKKLEAALKEKKRQHRSSEINKVIFIDDEIIPELHMGLFQGENTFDRNKVQDVYDKLKLIDIVCIVRRYYTTVQTTLVEVFYPEHLKKEAEYIQRLFMSSQSLYQSI